MNVLVGQRKLIKSGNIQYITCDGFFTTTIKLPEELPGNIPVAIMCMYIEPELIPVKSLEKAETIYVIDIDCRELLIHLAFITNTQIASKIQTAKTYVQRMSYFEVAKYDMKKTRFQELYVKYNLQNCYHELNDQLNDLREE